MPFDRIIKAIEYKYPQTIRIISSDGSITSDIRLDTPQKRLTIIVLGNPESFIPNQNQIDEFRESLKYSLRDEFHPIVISSLPVSIIQVDL